MPSTPRLSTPARSTTSSPAAASSSGVEAASTASTIASSNPIGGPVVRGHDADAVEDEAVAGEHVEQQQSLKDLGEVERHLEHDLRALAADEGERQEQAGDQDAEGIESAEERHDDG